MDFPVLVNSIFATLVFLTTVFLTSSDTWIKLLVASLCTSSLIFNLKRIGTYCLSSFKSFFRSNFPSTKNGLKVYSANLHMNNKKFSLLKESLNKHNPDFLFLSEFGSDWNNHSSFLKNMFKYKVKMPRDDFFGLAAYSKFPITAQKTIYLNDDAAPGFSIDVKVNETLINFICFHPKPPRPKNGGTKLRDEQLERLATIFNNSTKPIILMGDFNDVPWSYSMRKFLSSAKIKDPRKKFGLINTIPSIFPLNLFGFPIDHIFTSNHFEIIDFDSLEGIGSDHRPVLATIVTIWIA